MGLTFTAPELAIDGTIEPAGNGQLSQIIAARSSQDVLGWMKLERVLAKQLKTIEIAPRSAGGLWLAIGLGVLLVLGIQIFGNPTAVADGMRDLLRL